MKNFFVYPVLLTLSLLSGKIGAQSFLKKYTNQGINQGTIVPSVFSYPNGDIGLTLQHQWLNNTLRLLRTDAGGDLLDVTPQALPDNFQHYLEQDGGLISAAGDNDSLKVWKYNPDGSPAWQQVIPLAVNGEVQVLSLITENAGGDIFIRGFYYSAGVPHFQFYVAKLDPAGVLQWVNTAITLDYTGPIGVAPENTGGCLSGFYAGDTLIGAPLQFYHGLWRYNSDGTTAWSIKSGGGLGYGPVSRGYGSNDAGQSLVIAANDLSGTADTFYWMLLGPAGDTIWDFDATATPGLELLRPQVVIPDGNAGFIVAGMYENHPANQYIATVAKISVSGTVEWVRTFAPLSAPQSQLSDFQSGRILSDGSILLAGVSGDDVFLLKIPPDGSFVGFQNTVEGHVAYDSGFDCGIDPADPPAAGWVVTAQTANYQTYGSTDADGAYRIPFVDTGFYQIILTPPNYLWQACADTVAVYFPFSGATPLADTVDFPVQTPDYCPLPEVSLNIWNLRSCAFRPAKALVCNYGPAPAAPMQLTLTLDPLLTLIGSDHAFTVSGDTVVFAPDTLAPLTCTLYAMTLFTSCDAELGQTLCVKAHVSPDTICGDPPDWSGANIVVDGVCEGDSVRFRIQNTGGAPTTQDLDFVIIDDHVITRMGQFNLPAGAIHEETVEASGATWRMVADQEPGHPFGQQPASVAVEACSATGQFSTGMVNLFANNSGSPFEDIECREVTGSYDPNDKTGFPLGLHEYHCIEAWQELDYLIRFQNTGTDTAFYVEIQDTLSPWLDPASIRSVASSHPFQWSLSGPGIVKFVFENIALPDSTADEAASHGFVRFGIAQRPGNPPGAVLENRAGIYFDDNAAVLTNTTYHMVCADFIEIDLETTAQLAPEQWADGLRVFPNPAGQEARVQVETEPFRGGQIRLLDVYGRVVWQQPVLSRTLTIRRNGWAAGLYFVEFEGEKGLRKVQRVVFE